MPREHAPIELAEQPESNVTGNDDKQEKTIGNPPTSGLGRVYSHSLLLLLAGLPEFTFGGSLLRGRGKLAGRGAIVPRNQTQADVKINMSGELTHLGKADVTLLVRYDVTGELPRPLAPAGTGVITTANGDTISFTIEWSADPLAAAIFHVLGPFEINGGTGRFHGATGCGRFDGSFNTLTGEISGEIEGELQ